MDLSEVMEGLSLESGAACPPIQEIPGHNLDPGAARPPIQEMSGLNVDSGRQSGPPVAIIPPSFDGFGPSQPSQRQGTTRTGPLRGAPFLPHHEYHTIFFGDPEVRLHSRIVVEQDGSADEEERIYFVERIVAGANEHQNLHLLRCDEVDCNAFGYIYRDVVYTYGFHNHM